MGKIRNALAIISISAVVGAGSYAYNSFAAGETTTDTTIITTTADTVQNTAPLEKMNWEYYSVVQHAVSNGWTCETVDRCDKHFDNLVYAYLWNPGVLGKSKITVLTEFDVSTIDLTVVYVDQYGGIINTETFTLSGNGGDTRIFIKEFTTVPPDTKYVLFSDVTNIVKA